MSHVVCRGGSAEQITRHREVGLPGIKLTGNALIRLEPKSAPWKLRAIGTYWSPYWLLAANHRKTRIMLATPVMVKELD